MTSTGKDAQYAETTQKTASMTREAAPSAFQSSGSAPDVATLNAGAIATFYSELDRAWELHELSGDFVAESVDDAFDFAATGKASPAPDNEGVLVGLPPVKSEAIDGSSGDDYIEGISAGEEIYGGDSI